MELVRASWFSVSRLNWADFKRSIVTLSVCVRKSMMKYFSLLSSTLNGPL